MGVAWDATAFKNTVHGNARKRVLAICVAGVAHAKQNIPRVPDAPSPEGGFPFGKSGWLGQRVSYDVRVDAGGVHGMFGMLPVERGGPGSEDENKPLGYAYYLETGTTNEVGDEIMAPRPWVTLTMNELEALFGIKFKRRL